MIALSEPNIGENEKAAVQACLESGWVSSAAPVVTEFENAVTNYCDRKFAVATVNGTAALHLALISGGVQSGDLVITSDLAFVAAANAIHYCGAEPVFVDVRESDWMMDCTLIQDWLNQNAEIRKGVCVHAISGKRISAILAVDILGYPSDYEALQKICDTYNLLLIIDAAESLGSVFEKKPNASYGDISILSFNGNKIMTSGGGGMLLCDDERIANLSRHLSTQAKAHPTEYVHDATGYNYRMPGINAALGLAQFKRMEGFLKRKKEVAEFYTKSFENISDIQLYHEQTATNPNHWMFTILSSKARELEKFLTQNKIQSRKLWQPLHDQDPFDRCIFIGFENISSRIYEQSLSLPCSTGIRDEDLHTVVNKVKEFFS